MTLLLVVPGACLALGTSVGESAKYLKLWPFARAGQWDVVLAHGSEDTVADRSELSFRLSRRTLLKHQIRHRSTLLLLALDILLLSLLRARQLTSLGRALHPCTSSWHRGLICIASTCLSFIRATLESQGYGRSVATAPALCFCGVLSKRSVAEHTRLVQLGKRNLSPSFAPHVAVRTPVLVGHLGLPPGLNRQRTYPSHVSEAWFHSVSSLPNSFT